jgi:hypothetical protein
VKDAAAGMGVAVTARARVRRDRLEREIEAALDPGKFISRLPVTDLRRLCSLGLIGNGASPRPSVATAERKRRVPVRGTG